MTNSKSSLLCVITGMEHSGTTALGFCLNSHSQVMSGIECGILLGNLKNFHTIEPFYRRLQLGGAQWGIPIEHMSEIVEAASYEECYGLLKKYGGLVQNDARIRGLYENSRYVIDKTPRYIYGLEQIMQKVTAPFIVIRKNIFDLYASHKKRKDVSLREFIKSYLRTERSIRKCQAKYPERMLTVCFKAFLARREKVLQKICAFIQLPYEEGLSVERFFEKTGYRDKLPEKTVYGGIRFDMDNTPSIALSLREKAVLFMADFLFVKPGLLKRIVKI